MHLVRSAAYQGCGLSGVCSLWKGVCAYITCVSVSDISGNHQNQHFQLVQGPEAKLQEEKVSHQTPPRGPCEYYLRTFNIVRQFSPTDY